ncbi:UMP kinase [Candidatus Gracilibacteria bacterium]|nr:UMP kinase [Candidatus Gracilibacteria bacterium]MBF0913856.1 UMP kinase [Candidatus Gracilibacteria bacterium]
MRVLLKISGEALSGGKGFGFDEQMLHRVAEIVKELIHNKHQVGIVVGAGNFIRGAEVKNIDRCIADNMGMLAININALALFDYLQKKGIKSRNLNSFAIDGVADRFNKPKAEKFLDNGGVIIFGGGTGNPFFTTDTAGVLRALEIEADLMIKATKVDGLYDKDPEKYDDAKFIKSSTYGEILEKDYKVMDLAAIALAKSNNLKLKIVSLFKQGAILNAVNGDDEGTVIH